MGNLVTSSFETKESEIQKALEMAMAGDSSLLIKLAQERPDLAHRLKLLNDDPAKRALARKIESVLHLGKTGFDIATSIQQISRGKEGYDSLQAPRAPTYPRTSPALTGAIDRAISTSSSPSMAGVMSPYQAEMGRGYEQGRQAAMIASGGQSGVYSSLAQNLYNRRMQSAEQLPAMAAQLRSQENQNLSGLLGQQADIDRARAAFDANMFAQKRRIYETEATAAGQLEATGRQNLSNTINAALPNIANQIAPIFGIKELDDFNAKVNASPSLRVKYMANPTYLPTQVRQMPIGMQTGLSNMPNPFSRSMMPYYGQQYYNPYP